MLQKLLKLEFYRSLEMAGCAAITGLMIPKLAEELNGLSSLILGVVLTELLTPLIVILGTCSLSFSHQLQSINAVVSNPIATIASASLLMISPLYLWLSILVSNGIYLSIDRYANPIADQNELNMLRITN